MANNLLGHQVPLESDWVYNITWLRYLTVDQSARVRELAWANKCMNTEQSSLIKLTVRIENLHRVTELDLDLHRYSQISLSHSLGYRSRLFCMLMAQTEEVQSNSSCY